MRGCSGRAGRAPGRCPGVIRGATPGRRGSSSCSLRRRRGRRGRCPGVSRTGKHGRWVALPAGARPAGAGAGPGVARGCHPRRSITTGDLRRGGGGGSAAAGRPARACGCDPGRCGCCYPCELRFSTRRIRSLRPGCDHACDPVCDRHRTALRPPAGRVLLSRNLLVLRPADGGMPCRASRSQAIDRRASEEVATQPLRRRRPPMPWRAVAALLISGCRCPARCAGDRRPRRCPGQQVLPPRQRAMWAALRSTAGDRAWSGGGTPTGRLRPCPGGVLRGRCEVAARHARGPAVRVCDPLHRP